MRLPSVKTLSQITDKPKTLRVHLEEYRAGVKSLHATMETADELISGYGVEYIRLSEDSMHNVQGIEYVNMGDPYIRTLLFLHSSGTFSVGSWGAIVENAPDGKYV